MGGTNREHYKVGAGAGERVAQAECMMRAICSKQSTNTKSRKLIRKITQFEPW